MREKLFWIAVISLVSLPVYAQEPCAPDKDAGPDKCKIVAGDPAGMTPRQKIEAFQARVKTDVRRSMTDAQKQAFLNRLHDFFDFSTMAEAALFGEWEKRTTAERVQFTVAFTAMLQRNYLKKLYTHADYAVTVSGEKVKEGRAQVATKLSKAQKGSSAVDVSYRLQKTPQGWRIYDVVTDEVSLIRNYRSTFAELIKTKGFTGLIEHLKKQGSGPLP